MKKYISYRTTNLITHGQSPQPMVSKYCSLCDIQSEGLLGVPHSAMRVSPCQVVRDIRVVKHHIFMYAATSQGRREMKWGLPVIYWLVYNNNYNNIIQNAGNNLVYLSIPEYNKLMNQYPTTKCLDLQPSLLCLKYLLDSLNFTPHTISVQRLEILRGGGGWETW